jgi:flagellar biosynthesis GTPase FlhF
MSNFELIDDYLSDRLKGAEKEAFDKQLENDPALKSEVGFQKQIIEGIRNARATELKAMLNKVAVGGASVTMDFSVVRMAAGLIAAGVVGAAIYFYITRGELPPFDKAATDLNKKTEEINKQQPVEQDKTEVAPDSNENPDAKEETPAIKEDDSKKEKSKKEADKQSEEIKPAEKPKLDVANPSEELESADNSKTNEATSMRRSDITPSHIQVEMDSSNKKYDFHYQFVDSKLRLYGSFDRSLYEVLEINGDNHAVFLFYKDVYYVLDENQEKISKLEPIKDASLVNKLREYRKR